jgi:hypothetical protein
MRLCSKAAVLFAIFVPLAGNTLAQDAHYGKNGPTLLPDTTVTKGVVALSDTQTVCTTVWGKDERHVTPAMKKQVYAKYGTAPGVGVCVINPGKHCQPVKEGCEVDHLVSRELGGADDVDNLWPQPYTQHPGAHEKDWLENQLHKLVCTAKMITLAKAQDEIKTDWYASYLKRHAAPPK